MYKALVGKAIIPLQDFHHPYRINRHKHPHTFRQLQNRSEVYKNSFIPSTIVAWNALPTEAFGDQGITSEHVSLTLFEIIIC